MDKKPTPTFGSLFSGIGGIDLGLERAGMRCEWQVEIDDYATKVLAKHWPDTPRFRDVRECGKHNLAHVDLIAGGFPCQDISDAGQRAGIEGERSGLWAHFYRIICELQPRYVLVENVAALTHRGMGRVLGDLAAGGYDAEWQILPAAAFGAPHIRERVFIVAYANSTERRAQAKGRNEFYGDDARWQEEAGGPRTLHSHDGARHVADTNRDGGRWAQRTNGRDVADSQGTNAARKGDTQRHAAQCSGANMADPDFQGLEVGTCFGRDARQKLTAFERDCSTGAGQWAVEPAICRVVDGVPHRVDRLRGLGNAVVPQVAEYIGRCIMAAEAESESVA